jgi:hypothetical protein
VVPPSEADQPEANLQVESGKVLTATP